MAGSPSNSSSRKNISTNVTRCFTANQALFLALAGTYIISPFVRRQDDISEDGISEDGIPVAHDTVEILEIYLKHNLHHTLVQAASIRHPLHIIAAAKAGADIAAVPFKVLEQAAIHPLTDKGIDDFLRDWSKFTSEHTA